jgi:hypothetical protein
MTTCNICNSLEGPYRPVAGVSQTGIHSQSSIWEGASQGKCNLGCSSVGMPDKTHSNMVGMKEEQQLGLIEKIVF